MVNERPDLPWMDIDKIQVEQNGLIWTVRAEFMCTDSDPEVQKLSGKVEMQLRSLPASSPLALSDLIRRRIAAQLLRSAEGIEAEE